MRFLSDEWFAAVDGPLVAGGDGPTPPLVVSHRVPDAPDGPVAWLVELDAGTVRVHRVDDDTAAAAEVRFEHDYATATAISRGDMSAQSAFILGRLRVGGDVTRLVAARSGLDALAGHLGTVRDRTEY